MEFIDIAHGVGRILKYGNTIAIIANGIDPTVQAWKFQILLRLQSNGDHYTTEDLARGFVLSTVEGSAAEIVEPISLVQSEGT